MSKYFALVRDEQIDSDFYYDENEALQDDVAVLNGDGSSILNGDMVTTLISDMESCQDELDELNLYDYKWSEIQNRFNDIIDGYVNPLGGYKYTDKDRNALAKAVKDVLDASTLTDQLDVACTILTIQTGGKQQYVYGTITGAVQGDYAYYVCPQKIEADKIPYIEAVIFGTGTELVVIDKAYADDEFPTEDDFDLAYSMYTEKSNLEVAVAKELGVSDSDVVIIHDYNDVLHIQQNLILMTMTMTI